MTSTFLILFTSLFFAFTPTNNESLFKNDVPIYIIDEVALIEFQVYGELAPDGYIDEANSITEAYGFIISRVAGCEITKELQKKVHKKNNQSLKYMNTIYGKDWKENFTKETGLELAIPFN